MQFTTDTPRIDREFQGLPIAVPAPLIAGFTLTAESAQWVNGQLATVTGNSFGGHIRRLIEAENLAREAKAKEKGKDTYKPATVEDVISLGQAQTAFDEIYANYEMVASNRGGGGTSSTAMDPVTKLARSLAEVDLVARINAEGLTVTAFRKVIMEDKRTKFTHLLDDQFESGKESSFTDKKGNTFQGEYIARARALAGEGSSLVSGGEADPDLTLEAA